MKIYTHEPQQVLRIAIKRVGDITETLTIVEATPLEFEAFVRELIIKQNLSPFESGRVTSIDIREAVGGKNGKQKSISFKGLSPKEVKQLIEKEIK